jgi:hypothetical protein
MRLLVVVLTKPKDIFLSKFCGDVAKSKILPAHEALRYLTYFIISKLDISFHPEDGSGIFSSKRRFLQEPHGVTSQKTPFFIVTAVKISNIAWH